MRTRRVLTAALIGSALLVVPDAEPSPVTMSLVALESAAAVDFQDGVVWVLALGSDARPPVKTTKGNADAIELVGLDFESGTVLALGVPRDTWTDVDNHGFRRINASLPLGGPKLAAAEVEQLTGIAPHFVLTAGFDGFADTVDAVGGVRVGGEQLDGVQATEMARSRRGLPRSDFDRVANQQTLLRAILDRIRAGEVEEGFIEDGAIAVLKGLETNLDASRLYRFAQAVTRLDPAHVTTCVLPARPGTIGKAQVLFVEPSQARAIGADAGDNLVLDNGCPS